MGEAGHGTRDTGHGTRGTIHKLVVDKPVVDKPVADNVWRNFAQVPGIV